MKVRNIHERTISKSAKEIGVLIDSLASERDKLWPNKTWPAMKLDRPLGIGAIGGHGPIGYKVEKYELGAFIQFRFLKPEGFDGYHRFEIEEVNANQTLLRHIIEMQVTGKATLPWLSMIRPLHDALMEDALDRAESTDEIQSKQRNWSLWVKLIRWAMSKKKRN